MLAETPVIAIELPRRSLPVWLRLMLLLALAVVSIAVFMTIDARGNWDFVIPFRGRKVLGIVTVAYAIAVSTVLFQTITTNRILTPSIMGFDALYMLIQTVVVYLFGSATLLTLDPRLQFAVEAAIMTVFATALYVALFVVGHRSLHLLVLIGILFGILFRSLTTFMQRLIDPNDFVILQDAGFASFNAIDQTLLGVSMLLIGAISVALWRLNPVLDVLALGRETAINLGVNYRLTVTVVLALVTLLVSLSTALVGPITFFGLLVANLAYTIAGSHRHRVIVPAATLLAITALVGGQTILERVFSFNSSLSIMIEFVGGITFLYLLLRGRVR